MSKIADKFNVDLTDLQNLLEGVVAYVEVRVDNDDISNDIAREMREIGAVISENKNNKVTHVIFRNGTLRTSNWAKKHDIPLVDIGWLASCTKNKINLVSRPWHVRYLEDSVDIFGSKKRKRYKKYFKNMNVEEYEAAMLKVKEKRQKQLEKSLNNSKSDLSFGSPVDQHLKRSDQLRKPPTPEIVKRYEARLEKYKKTGRYSWETEDDISKGSETDELNMENSPAKTEKNMQNLLDECKSNDKGSIEIDIENSVVDENQAPKSADKTVDISDKLIETGLVESNKSNEITETQNSRKILKSRRLFSQLNLSNDNLIEPVSKINKTKESKTILPEAVQKVISGNVKKSSNRKSISNTKKEVVKRPGSVLNDVLDICLPAKKIAREENNKPSLPKMHTPIKNVKSILSTSPLITNKSTPINKFATPKISKRKSLRTRLLKQSAKKKYRETGYIEDLFYSSDDDKSEILVPETVKVDRVKNVKDIDECMTIFETPEFSNVSNKKGNSFKNTNMQKNSQIPPENNGLLMTPELVKNRSVPQEEFLTSSMLNKFFDTPNASRFLDQIIPNRKKPNSYDHILFIPKEAYDHCTKVSLPNFSDQKNYIRSAIQIPLKDDINTINFNETGRKSSEIRRSVRLSARKSENHIDLCSDELEKVSNSIKTSNSKNIDCDKSTNTPISIFTTQSQSSTPTENQFPLINGKLLTVQLDPLEIFNCNTKNQLPSTRYHNTRKSSAAKPLSDLMEKPVTESTTVVNRKRAWSQVEQNKVSIKRLVKEKSKTNRDSLDDFVLYPLTQKRINKVPINTGQNELILVCFSQENQNQIKCVVNKLPHVYKFVDFIRSKEQIVIIPEKPKRSIELIRAFVYGNTFVSEKWIYQSYEFKKWLNYSSFIIKDTDIIDIPISNVEVTSSLFNDYSSMYVSSTANGIQKYKLRIIIESAGGKVSDSFRQAGIVINTRKVNALSINENWILDSIKEGKVLDTKKYLIL